MQKANNIEKLSNDLTLQLNKSQYKIADTIIDKMSKAKVSEQVHPAKKIPNFSKKERKLKPKHPEENATLKNYVKISNTEKQQNTNVLERLDLTNMSKKNIGATKKILTCKIRYKNDHKDILSYKEETNTRYCRTGNDL